MSPRTRRAAGRAACLVVGPRLRTPQLGEGASPGPASPGDGAVRAWPERAARGRWTALALRPLPLAAGQGSGLAAHAQCAGADGSGDGPAVTVGTNGCCSDVATGARGSGRAAGCSALPSPARRGACGGAEARAPPPASPALGAGPAAAAPMRGPR